MHVPALPGYRAWPADSALPPRFVAACGGALHGRRIVLDPEGGGDDAAGQGPGGTRAATLNLECARVLAGFLAAAGAQVRLTRAGDLALSEVERVQASEAFGAERFLRIAHRAGSPRLGAHPSSVTGRAWAARTAAALAALGRSAPPVTDEAAYVIRQTSCPALLASPGSLGDEASEARLLAPGALRAEAYALFLGLAREWAPDAAWPADSLAVLDDAGRGAAAVPHQVVKVRDMHQEHVRVVDDVPGVGWLLPGWVVLQVHPRQAPLGLAQDLVLVLKVVLLRLVEDGIQIQILDLFCRHIAQIVGPGHAG